MASLRCPHCGSMQVQRVKALVEAVQTVHSREVSAAVKWPLATKEKPAVVAGLGTTAHRANSAMLTRLAPPLKRGYIGKAAVLACCVLMAVNITDTGAKALYAGFAGLAAYFLFRAYQHNTETWPRQMTEWERAWHCHQCGREFLP